MLRFIPITAEEYSDYAEASILAYAADHVVDGRWSAEESVDQARQEFAQLLPDGPATQDHFINMLVNEREERVGVLWFHMQGAGARRSAYVYDIIIYPAYRRQGYGELALRQLEDVVRDLGGHRVSLHVFGHNQAAYALYVKLGFFPTNINMAKDLV